MFTSFCLAKAIRPAVYCVIFSFDSILQNKFHPNLLLGDPILHPQCTKNQEPNLQKLWINVNQSYLRNFQYFPICNKSSWLFTVHLMFVRKSIGCFMFNFLKNCQVYANFRLFHTRNFDFLCITKKNDYEQTLGTYLSYDLAVGKLQC